MWKTSTSVIKKIFKLSVAFILVILVFELLETYLWNDNNVPNNSKGYRDREYSFEKPANIFRILVLGDSQTFGQGLKSINDTWHKKLEYLINLGFKSPRFEIISLAGKGWNTDTQLFELFRKGFKYNPDLILIGFNLNDPPAPHFFKCNHQDFQLFPYSKSVTWLRNISKVFQLLEFRLNRLIENFEQKPNYTECINQRYESRGWDMELVYLDTITMAAQIKNIHLMITTLPMLYKLDDDYPLKKPHLKIKTYCKERGLECLDLYDKGFKGLSAAPLLASITDRHFNENGTEIVAQTLFKRLQSLKIYKNLAKFSGVFGLNELLDQKPIIVKLDDKFSKIKETEGMITVNLGSEKLKVINKNKSFQYRYSTVNAKKLLSKNITLDSKGNFINSSIAYKRDNFNSYNIDKKRKNGNHLIRKYFINTTNETIEEQETLYYLKIKNNVHIDITKNYFFWDPKVFEKNIFSQGIQRGPETEKKIFEGLKFYKIFNFNNLNHNNYFNKIVAEILKKKPSLAAVRAVNRIQSQKNL